MSGEVYAVVSAFSCRQVSVRFASIACAAIALLALAAASDARTSAKPRCRTRAGTTVLADRSLRIFTRRVSRHRPTAGVPYPTRMYACIYRSNRLITLAYSGQVGDSGLVKLLPRSVQVNDGVAGFVQAWRTDSDSDDHVVAVDLRTRKVTDRGVAVESSADNALPRGIGEVDNEVTDLAVGGSGELAWIAHHSAPPGSPGSTLQPELQMLEVRPTPAEVQLLDRGNIELDSLAFSDGTFYWTRDGAPHSFHA